MNCPCKTKNNVHPRHPSPPVDHFCKTNRVLSYTRMGSGRRAQVLVLAELLSLCEGKSDTVRSNHDDLQVDRHKNILSLPQIFFACTDE